MVSLQFYGTGTSKGGKLSNSHLVGVWVVAIVLLFTCTLAHDPPAAEEEPKCLFNAPVTSCDNNKLRYSVVLDSKHGEKFIINHSIERIPPTKPTRKPLRTKRPRVGPDGEVVSMFPGLWRAKMGAWRDKMRLLIAKRRAQMRRQRTQILNRANRPLLPVS